MDGGVILLDGSQGVEPQSETVYRQAQKYDVPLLFFINKLDKVGGDFYMSVESIAEKLTDKGLPIQLPIGREGDFTGMIDLVKMRAYKFEGELGKEVTEYDIPEDLLEKANNYRKKMMEKVAESDNKLIEKYLSGEELTEDEIRTGLRKLTINTDIYPIYCGTSLQNKMCCDRSHM